MHEWKKVTSILRGQKSDNQVEVYIKNYCKGDQRNTSQHNVNHEQN